ncbi:MAG TPA: beta-propeller fold lactonase family protein [Beijerinckiaceae bacterium]|nr:beta-propeller fold lactonase family protein [Beijerinckiaceae bacterium]
MPKGPFVFVSGRWDNVVSIVDVAAAMQPANNATPAAIVNQVRVTPDIDSAGVVETASGQPVNLVIAADGRHAYVVNHSGRVTPAAAAAFQHGHPGTITVLDVAKALDPASRGTTNAIVDIIDTGTAGPVGIALTPDQKHLVVSSAEAAGSEDGVDRITLIDTASRKVVRQVKQALAGEGDGAPRPNPHAAPHAGYGRFPNANGVAVSPLDGGIIVTGNGGTDDVSVISLARALKGEPAEMARVPVQTGPFGVAVSPDGRLAAVASRESMRTGIEGNTISLIDLARATSDAGKAEMARVRVGTDRADEATRPFAVAFTRDGRSVLASCFRSNMISLVDVERALAGAPAERRLHVATSSGGPGRPRGVAMLPDGRHAAVIGGAKAGAGSSLVWIIDLERLTPVGCVTGVGNGSYLLDVLPVA